MAEIKSTLELAMERTKKMSISEDEKEAIRRKEIVQKATGMFHRYLQDHMSLDEVVKEIERMEDKAGTTIREYLCSKWIDAVSVDLENEKFLRGIESLKGGRADDARQRLESLRSDYEKEKDQARQKIGARLEEALRREGVHGSAVVPHIEGSREWKERIGAVENAFKEKIEVVKEVLRRL